MYDYIPQIFL